MSPATTITATYRLSGDPARAAARAEAIALEQSIEMPAAAVMDPRVLDAWAGRVLALDAQADGSTLARVALGAATVGHDPGQLMNMLYGNTSLQPAVELVDVELPPLLAQAFGGPALGLAGLRALTGVHGRPLTCTALKPLGSTPQQLGALCGTFARAGIDVIKDDHGWSDIAVAPFAARVRACTEAVVGTAALYAPSLSGPLDAMRAQIDLARRHGVRAVLIAPLVAGVSNFHALRRAHPDLAFLAHPALAGHQIAPPVLLGSLLRAFGADAVIFPHFGGRFAYSHATCMALADRLRAPWQGLAAACPVPAGGMTVERVGELVNDYGNDVMLLIGGGLLMAREALAERSAQFVAAVRQAAAQAAVAQVAVRRTETAAATDPVAAVRVRGGVA